MFLSRRLLIGVLALALVASGCFGGDDGGEEETSDEVVDANDPLAYLDGEAWATVELRLNQLAAARFQLDLAINAAFAQGGESAQLSAVADVDTATTTVAVFADELALALDVAIPPGADSTETDEAPASTVASTTSVETTQDSAAIRSHLTEVVEINQSITDLMAATIESGNFFNSNCIESTEGWWSVSQLATTYACSVGFNLIGQPVQISGSGPRVLVSGTNGGFVLAGGTVSPVLGAPPLASGSLLLVPWAGESSEFRSRLIPSLGDQSSLTFSGDLGEGGSPTGGTQPFDPPVAMLGTGLAADTPGALLLSDPLGTLVEIDPDVAKLLALLPIQYRVAFVLGWNLTAAPPMASPSVEACRELRDGLDVRVQFVEDAEGALAQVIQAKEAQSVTGRSEDLTRLQPVAAPSDGTDGYRQYTFVLPVRVEDGPPLAAINFTARNRCGQASVPLTPGATGPIVVVDGTTTTLPVITSPTSTSTTLPPVVSTTVPRTTTTRPVVVTTTTSPPTTTTTTVVVTTSTPPTTTQQGT